MVSPFTPHPHPQPSSDSVSILFSTWGWLLGRPTCSPHIAQHGEELSWEWFPYYWLSACITVASHKCHGISNQRQLDCLFTSFVQAGIKANIKALHCWSFVRGIHLWPVDSPHKGPAICSHIIVLLTGHTVTLIIAFFLGYNWCSLLYHVQLETKFISPYLKPPTRLIYYFFFMHVFVPRCIINNYESIYLIFFSFCLFFLSHLFWTPLRVTDVFMFALLCN